MAIVTIEEAQSQLPEIIERLVPGEEVLISSGGHIVARMVRAAPKDRRAPKFGTLRGTVLYMAPDFDATPEEFLEYAG